MKIMPLERYNLNLKLEFLRENFMKNIGLWQIWALFAVIVLAGCNTVNLMIDRSDPEKPVWAESPHNFYEWRRAQVDSYRYFLGISKRDFKELEKAKIYNWTEQQAFNEASSVAKEELGQEIMSVITSENKDYFKVKNDVADEEFSSVVSVSSSVIIQNSSVADRYTETHRQISKKGENTTTITTTYLWIVYSISKEDIEKAQARIIEEFIKEHDAKKRRENLERLVNEQERSFDDLFRNVKRISDLLSSFNDDRQFGKRYAELQFRYIELQNINWKLQNLNFLENRNDEIGEKYKNLKFDIEKLLLEYDPINRQNKEIENLLREINEKDRIIQAGNALGEFNEKTEKELRDEIAKKEMLINQLIAEKHGHSILSQTVLVSHPQKPNEIKSVNGNIYAASSLVTNQDFISFSISKGINNLSKSERGLDVPVVSITWDEAAHYCNWLSKLYNYEPCYIEVNKHLVYDRNKNGYRLPEKDEIVELLNERLQIINTVEFFQIGLWSSDGGRTEHQVYRLSEGSGTAIENLTSQPINNAIRDPYIGFRVVRNAK
jgi:hypothetical protein